MNAIFWLKDKYSLVEEDTFWLSDTPDIESRYTYVDDEGEEQEAGCNRICTYAVLKNNETGEIVIHMNTHLDNSSVNAANFGAQIIIEKLEVFRAQYGSDVNVILTGDFNETIGDEAYLTVACSMKDSTDQSKTVATYQDWGYTSTGNMPIDFVFSSTDKTSNYTILNDISNGYVSDHYGVYTQLTF
jgi:endonuclease/exonuclease/phosphatase family metal-dependent hydrolase